MKLLAYPTFILIFFFNYSAQARSPIVKIEYKIKEDLYLTDHGALRIKVIRKNDNVHYTGGYAGYALSWKKITLSSDQADFNSIGKFSISRNALFENDHKLTVKVRIQEGSTIYLDTFEYELPQIVSISPIVKEIIPYTDYPRAFWIRTTEKSYKISTETNYPGFIVQAFTVSYSNGIVEKPSTFWYAPKNIARASVIRMTVKHRRYNQDTTFLIPVQPLKILTLNFEGSKGRKGNDGEDGPDGGTGEDGGDGGGGWNGERGDDGPEVELMVRSLTSQNYQITVFEHGKQQSYFLPKNCMVYLNSIGGSGGNGGKGGTGGSGGSSSDDYEAGTSGSDGPGGNGGFGGHGGTIRVYASLDLHQLASVVELSVEGGEPGKGGSGSPNGSIGKKGYKGVIEFTVMDEADINLLFKQIVVN